MSERKRTKTQWAILHAAKVLYEKHGVGNEEFYADMAKSFWLCDKDAVEDKLGAYYENVVRH